MIAEPSQAGAHFRLVVKKLTTPWTVACELVHPVLHQFVVRIGVFKQKLQAVRSAQAAILAIYEAVQSGLNPVRSVGHLVTVTDLQRARNVRIGRADIRLVNAAEE
jgi:hypothetical protein